MTEEYSPAFEAKLIEYIVDGSKTEFGRNDYVVVSEKETEDGFDECHFQVLRLARESLYSEKPLLQSTKACITSIGSSSPLILG